MSDVIDAARYNDVFGNLDAAAGSAQVLGGDFGNLAGRGYQHFPGIRPMPKTEAEKAVYEAEAAYEVAKSTLAVERAQARLERAEKRLEEVRGQPLVKDQEFAGVDFEPRVQAIRPLG